LDLILELLVRETTGHVFYPADRLAQFLNSRVEHAFMVFVIPARLGETRHLTPESLERRDGFDNNANACGWDNAGHTIRRVCELRLSLGFGNDSVKYHSVDNRCLQDIFERREHFATIENPAEV